MRNDKPGGELVALVLELRPVVLEDVLGGRRGGVGILCLGGVTGKGNGIPKLGGAPLAPCRLLIILAT